MGKADEIREHIIKIANQRGLRTIVLYNKLPRKENLDCYAPMINGQYCLIKMTYSYPMTISEAEGYTLQQVTALHCSDAQILHQDDRVLIKHDVLEELYSWKEGQVLVDKFDPHLATAEILAEVVHCGVNYRIEYTGDSISIRHKKEGEDAWSMPQFWQPQGTILTALIGVCRELQKTREECNAKSTKIGGNISKIW